MELIIGLIAAVAIGCFVFFRKKKEEAVAETAPYKVEPAPVTPEVVAVVETAPVSVVEPVVPVTLEVAESAPVAVAEAKSSVKKSRAPRPSVKKAPAKDKKATTRKPKAK